MEAGVLHCGSCGAGVAADALRCDHCGAPLATQACPSCLTMMVAEAKYCPQCGTAAVPWRGESTTLPCPKCQETLLRGRVGELVLHTCARCFGVWVDTTTLEHICRDAEHQSMTLTQAPPEPGGGTGQIEPIRYLRCPECRQLMNRVNFAQHSGVVVDICRAHGTWFDALELQRIIRFIRSGGFAQSLEREKQELAAQRRQLNAARWGLAGAGAERDVPDTGTVLFPEIVSALGGVLRVLSGRR